MDKDRNKTGGRRRGTPNKRTRAVIDLLKERFPEYHPVVAMAEIANDESHSVELRLQAHKEVAHYVAPTRKAVEITAEQAVSMSISEKPMTVGEWESKHGKGR